MPAGTSLGLGVVSGVVAGAPYADVIVAPIQIKTGASGVSAAGYCNLYVITSEDNVVWDSTISPYATGSQTSLLGGPRLVQTMATPTNATIYAFEEFSMWSKLGFIPAFCSVVVSNMSGATLDVSGANFSANYALDSYN